MRSKKEVVTMGVSVVVQSCIKKQKILGQADYEMEKGTGKESLVCPSAKSKITFATF